MWQLQPWCLTGTFCFSYWGTKDLCSALRPMLKGNIFKSNYGWQLMCLPKRFNSSGKWLEKIPIFCMVMRPEGSPVCCTLYRGSWKGLTQEREKLWTKMCIGGLWFLLALYFKFWPNRGSYLFPESFFIVKFLWIHLSLLTQNFPFNVSMCNFDSSCSALMDT